MYLFQQKYKIRHTSRNIKFTFHYVSISTVKKKLNNEQCTKFTFHYVSISTEVHFF